MAEEPKKKPNILLRFLAFLVTLALMLGAVALVVYREDLNFDALRRYFTYRSLTKSDTGQLEPFSYDGGGRGGFSAVDGDLLIWSTTGVRLYSPSGVEYLSEPLLLHQPVAATEGSAAVVYDSGGNTLRVYQKRACAFSLDTEQGEEILAARLSTQGNLVVTTRAQGYKGIVTVYDSTFSPMLSLRLSSRFVMDGLLSNDGQTVALLTAGQNEAAFQSALSLYAIDGDEPFATVSLGSDMALDLKNQNGSFWVVGENNLIIIGADGSQKGQYSYSGRYLKGFSLGGDGFATLLLGKYRAGSGATLVTVDETGTVLATLELSEQILDLTAAGRYVAVLTANGLSLYTKDLTAYGGLIASSGARNVVLQADAAAFLVGTTTARLYIPN